MKITKSQLKQIIREEMNESAAGMEAMRQMGIAQDQENYGGPEVGGSAITPYSEMARAALRGDATKEGSGPWRALQRLKSLSSVEPEAQAMLDAVYEESPRLKPKAGLSPQARAGITAFLDEEIMTEGRGALEAALADIELLGFEDALSGRPPLPFQAIMDEEGYEAYMKGYRSAGPSGGFSGDMSDENIMSRHPDDDGRLPPSQQKSFVDDRPLRENSIKITKSQLKQIIKEEIINEIKNHKTTIKTNY